MDEVPKKKILIVDDDSFLLNMYQLKFEKGNYEVTSSMSSQDAINKLKDGLKPDVMIFDVIMPSMDGIELLNVIRSQHLADGAKCLMLTNQGESTDIERAKEIGIDGYIVKAASVPSGVVKIIDDILVEK